MSAPPIEPAPVRFTFITPLRSKAASQDWARVCRLLRNTVWSALNQTDPDFRILIACDDVPDMADIVDSRVEILHAPFPTPRSLEEQALDKRAKKRLAGAAVRAAGGGFVMLLDSDDFVSNRLVEQVRATIDGRGCFFPTGYEYFEQDRLLRRIDDFYRLCGSCYVINYAADELPLTSDGPETPFDTFTNHRLVRESAERLGWNLVPLPFPAAIYLRENGENHSVQMLERTAGLISRYRVKSWFGRMLRRFRRGRGLDPAVVREFSLPVASL